MLIGCWKWPALLFVTPNRTEDEACPGTCWPAEDCDTEEKQWPRGRDELLAGAVMFAEGLSAPSGISSAPFSVLAYLVIDSVVVQ